MRPGRRPESILFLQDNASPHTAMETKDTIRSLDWAVLQHPNCSPDLAPCAFYLFTAMKTFLKGRQFTDRSAIGTALFHWLNQQPKTWFMEGIMKLPQRWEKCVEVNGDVFEKWMTLNYTVKIAIDKNYLNLFCFDALWRNKLVCMFVFTVKNK